MTAIALKAALQAKPFRLFSVHLADGDKIDVKHPEALYLSQVGRTIIITNTADDMEIVDLLLVTKLTFRGSSKTNKQRNGH